jgi:hypothetical protein
MDELKGVFNTLDIFGNDKVQVRPFIDRMKTNADCKELLKANILYYPSLDKHCTFERVLFVLEHKK